MVAGPAGAGARRREGFEQFAILSLAMVLFLGAPLLALILDVHPQAWWQAVRSEAALDALVLTLWTTAVATAICVVLGLPLAYLLARFDFRGKGALDALVDLPVTIPPVVVGLALLLAFGRQGLIGQYFEAIGLRISFSSAAVVLAQVSMAAPFFVRTARAGFEAVDERLEQAAWSLGASPWHAFRRIALPLAAPSLLAGAVLAWARALSEFGATMMFAGSLQGRTQTLSLAVMSAMEADLDTAVAIATLSLLLGLISLLAMRWIAARLKGTSARGLRP